MATETSTPPVMARRKSRSWMWFFGVLALLGTTAVSLEIWYNLRQQLTREQIEQAQRLWKENDPGDYDFSYTIQRQGPSEGDTVDPLKAADGQPHAIQVRVRGGEVQTVSCDDKLLPPNNAAWTVAQLLEAMAAQKDADDQPGGPRVFTVAMFSRKDGHPLRYVRSVRQTRERVEITNAKVVPVK